MDARAILFAARAKGRLALLRRMQRITQRYGLTPGKMAQALDLFAQILGRFNCGASFPITAVTLARNPDAIRKYQEQNIEFAMHGYTHIDYSQLAPEQQLTHLQWAREVFAEAGINATGFRSPYLSRSDNLYASIEAAGFAYVSNQPVMWNALEAMDAHAGYQRALNFYAPWPAGEYPSLPRLQRQLVEIPVSLPDDEILLDRLEGMNNRLVERTWQRILAETYHRGELFTIQLHPERITLCAEDLAAVLSAARALIPAVWIARLDEIAAWWRARTEAKVDISTMEDGILRLAVEGPAGTTIFGRGVEFLEPTMPWADNYQQVKVKGNTCHLRASCLPFIGVSVNSHPELLNFLRQQGYIIQVSNDKHLYSIYLDQPNFTPENEYPLLVELEQSIAPLARLGRWPNGARSALSVTGDIDALTLWDYSLRFLGR